MKLHEVAAGGRPVLRYLSSGQIEVDGQIAPAGVLVADGGEGAWQVADLDGFEPSVLLQALLNIPKPDLLLLLGTGARRKKLLSPAMISTLAGMGIAVETPAVGAVRARAQSVGRTGTKRRPAVSTMRHSTGTTSSSGP